MGISAATLLYNSGGARILNLGIFTPKKNPMHRFAAVMEPKSTFLVFAALSYKVLKSNYLFFILQTKINLLKDVCTLLT
jgi:hypothetical protein